MVHVPLGVLEVERVDHLVHPEHPERRDVQDLRVAALEQRRPVRPGQEADVRRERTDVLGVRAVEADALLDHARPHHLLLEGLPRRRELLAARRELVLAERRGEVGLGLVLDGGHVASRSFLSGTIAAATLSFANGSSASQRSCWYSGCGSKSEGFTPTCGRGTPPGTRSPRR